MIQRRGLDDAALRDTLDAVFAGPEFTSVARETLLSRLLNWIGRLLRELQLLTGGSKVLYYSVLALAILFVAAVIARVIYVAHARGAFGQRRRGLFSAAAPAANRDQWILAQRLAAEGDYTAAAHALYMAILQRVAGDGLVRLHHAKTVGDYLREMRTRASASLLQSFREFARGYEYVVYGIGECDRARYERLYGLASELAGHG